MANLIGQIIDNYSFQDLLGRGGMGTVYRAIDVKLQREVAVKIIDESQISMNSTFLERFRREARNQAQLVHPNVVMVYGFIEYGDILGIAMEYVRGQSVDRILKAQGRLHIKDALHILKNSLAGLGYAHSQGFIHRDIKPSNIMIEPKGGVKLMDFGISKSIFEQGITKTGANIGTAYYMSPEQIKAKEITHHTDIYYMGCTFYELITGRPPFDFDTEYELFEHHLSKEPVPASKIYPDIPAAIDKIISKSMEKKYFERYNNCSEFAHAIDSSEQYVPKESTAGPKVQKKKASGIGIIFIVGFILFIAAIIYYIATHMDIFLNDNFLKQ